MTNLEQPELIPDHIIKKYQGVSTPTLYTLLFKRGYHNTYIQDVQKINTQNVKMVGQAFTLRYIPAREDIDTIAAFKDPKHPQRLAVESVPKGMVLVSDCRRDATAASAGCILLSRLEYRGCAGFVSDAGIRDTDVAQEMDFPVFCVNASAPTNLNKHHGVDLQVPIGCGGAPVYPGDLIIGDCDGVLVVPLFLALDESVVDEALEMERFESYVLDKVRNGSQVIGLYPPNDEARAEYLAAIKS